MKQLIGVAVLALAMPAHAGSIYLCKAYSGGQFWSSDTCSKHSALIQRIVSVPDTLPFDQQVRLAEQNRAEGERLAAPPRAVQEVRRQPDGRRECSALEAHIRDLDAAARQPLPAQQQDRIKTERREARDRQYSLKC